MSRLRANIVANYFGKGWEALMGVIFLPLYIRYLGAEAYGIVGFVALIQAWIALFDLGMTPTLVREMARHSSGQLASGRVRDLLRSIEFLTLGVAILGVTVVWTLSSILARNWFGNEALGTEQVSQALAISALVIGLRFCETIYRGSLLGLQRQVYLNLAAAVMATIRGGGAVALLVFVSTDIGVFLWWQAAVSLLTIGVLAWGTYGAIAPAERGGRFSRQEIREVAGFAGGIFAIQLVALLVTQADKLIVSGALTLAAFGYYVFATKVATVIGMVAQPILTAIYPRLVALAGAADSVRESSEFHRWAAILSTLAASAGAVLFFFSEQLVFAWSGDPQLVAATSSLIAILGLGAFFHVQAMLPYQMQLAHRWTSLAVWSNLAILVLSVPALWLAAEQAGAEGAAWVRTAVLAAYVVVQAIWMFGRILEGSRMRWLVRELALPTIAAFSAGWIVSMLVPPMSESRIEALLTVALAGAASLVMATASIWPQAWSMLRGRSDSSDEATA